MLIDRAMDIGVLAEFDDYSFGWRSATGFRHPGLHEVNDEEGLSWLRSMSASLSPAVFKIHTLFGGQFETLPTTVIHPKRQSGTGSMGTSPTFRHG